MADQPLRVDRADGRVTVTLTDPDVRNALTASMAEHLREAVTDIEDARCVVLQGSRGTFCAGGDVKAMVEGVSEDIPVEERIEAVARPLFEAVRAVASCPAPTVAKVDGAAFGAGAALAIACDVVLASERAKMSFGFRQVGLSVDSGTSYLLPRIVGENVAKELVYTGELVGAERAEDLGLFNRVFPVEEFEQETRAIVDRIASGPTVALEHSKRLLEADHDSLAVALDAEAEALETTIATADHVEGVAAFAEQRDPEFTGE